jgi:hypothetical protein
MRIFLPHRPGGAFGFITDGILNCLRDRGHDARRWDGNLDSWREFSPDLYIGASGHKQPIPEQRGACLVAMHVNPYGPVGISGINESQETIDWVLAQKPDAVWGYGFDHDRFLWSYWTKKHGIKWVPMPTAADSTLFRDLQTPRELDIVYLGGRWAYKGLTIDQYLVPVLRDKRMTSKLHGWGEWQPGLCQGILAEDEAAEFLNSGKIAPCVSEQHTQQHGIDIPERVWKVALCGTLAVHDPVPTMRKEFPSLIMGQNPQQYFDYCLRLSRPENDLERQEIAAAQKLEVQNKHTYHHRLARLFEDLGWPTEAKRLLK